MGIYSLVSSKVRKKLLPLCTAVVVCWAEPLGIIPLTVSVLSAYLGGIFIFNFRNKPVKQRIFLITAVALNTAGFLLFHKCRYDGSDLMTILGCKSLLKTAAVVGAAVYPLNSISYCVDIYRGKYRCEHHFDMVAGFVAFFPTFTAGPLTRFDKMRKCLRKPTVSFASGAKGIRLFLQGLFRKLILSNTMFELWQNVREISLDKLPAISAWIGMLAFALFVYFELSSFSLMASGIALLMGFELPENFDDPYTASSFKELIRRFNITLYRWNRRYIHHSISKGGSKTADIAGFCIAVLMGGFWYGISARVLIFSLAVLLMLVLEKLFETPLKKLPAFVRRLIFLFMFMCIMPLLAFSAPDESMRYIGAMFGSNHAAVDMLSQYLTETYLLFLVICIMAAGGLLNSAYKKAEHLSEYLTVIIQPVLTIAMLLLCTAFLIAGKGSLTGFLL